MSLERLPQFLKVRVELVRRFQILVVSAAMSIVVGIAVRDQQHVRLHPRELLHGHAEGEYVVADGLPVSDRQLHHPVQKPGIWREIRSGDRLPTGIDRDLAPSQFARNQTFFNTIVWDVNSNFQIGFEVDYRMTDYIKYLDAAGVNFMTQFQWKF